jgi:hypothetical protein
LLAIFGAEGAQAPSFKKCIIKLIENGCYDGGGGEIRIEVP